MTVIDGLNNLAIADIPVNGCPCWDLAVDPNTQKVFVPLGDAGSGESVAMLDAVSHSLIKDLDMDANSFYVALDTDRGLVYVTHGRPETSVLDSNSGDVLATLPVHGYVDVDSSTGTAYVADDDSNKIIVVPGFSR